MKRKTKQTLKMVALGVVGLGAVVGAVSVLGNLRSEDDGLKTIHPTFEVGGLNDADGKFEESKKTIYTKDAFECLGLEIEVDFDNNIKYQVFYYESDGDYISASQVLEGNQDLDVPLLATHARLEITPNWAEMGEDYKDTKNQEVKWYEVAKYATQLDIKVNSEQTKYDLIDYEVYATSSAFTKSNLNNSGMEFTEPESYDGLDVIKFNVKDVTSFKFITSEEHLDLAYIFVDSNNIVLYKGTYSKDIISEIDVISNSSICYLSVEQGSDYLISK